MVRRHQDDRFFAGTPREIVFDLLDDDAPPLADGSQPSLDTTGLSFEWRLAPRLSSGVFSKVPTVTKSQTAGIVVTDDGSQATARVTLEPADTEGLEGTYRHVLVAVDASDAEVPVAIGEVVIDRTVEAA